MVTHFKGTNHTSSCVMRFKPSFTVKNCVNARMCGTLSRLGYTMPSKATAVSGAVCGQRVYMS